MYINSDRKVVEVAGAVGGLETIIERIYAWWR